MLHNIYYTYKFIQTLQWDPIFAADYMVDTKKVDLIYGRSDFRHGNTWDEKRLASSYSSVQMIAKAYHLEREYKDASKFGSRLYYSALEPKNWVTRYCRPFNVGTFRFCWWYPWFSSLERSCDTYPTGWYVHHHIVLKASRLVVTDWVVFPTLLVGYLRWIMSLCFIFRGTVCQLFLSLESIDWNLARLDFSPGIYWILNH